LTSASTCSAAVPETAAADAEGCALEAVVVVAAGCGDGEATDAEAAVPEGEAAVADGIGLAWRGGTVTTTGRPAAAT
jgi:hypothetical protein